MSRLSLAIVVSHPIQYHSPLYRILAESAIVDPTVLFLSSHGVEASFDPGFGRTVQFDVPLTAGYEHKFLRNLRRSGDVFTFLGLVVPSVAAELRKRKFDAVLVHGYSSISHWMAYAAAEAVGLPYMIRGESRADTDVALPRWKLAAKRAVVGRLVQRAGACLAIGTLNRRFYEVYGAAPDRIIDAPYSIDNERFRAGGVAGREGRTQLLKSRAIDPTPSMALFAAKLQPWKRPGDLLEAARALDGRVSCVFIGDGPLRGELQRVASQVPNTHVLGFVNQSELPAWYGASDVFVLPSDHEPWGLTVNEALAAGTTPVVSNAVGCAADLVEERNRFAVGDISSLASILRRLLLEPKDAVVESSAGMPRYIEDFSLSATASGVELGALRATK